MKLLHAFSAMGSGVDAASNEASGEYESCRLRVSAV